MAQITLQEAVAYLARCGEVTRYRIAGLSRAPVGQRSRQLRAPSDARPAFGIDPDRSRRCAELAARWQRIRTCCGE